MKTLSSTLLAAQQSGSARPYVKARFRDFYSEGPRARFQHWYSGSEADGPVACIAAADGALLRARNDDGALYVSRVAAPDTESTYSSWTSVETMFASTGIALIRMPNDDLWLFYVETNHTTIELRISTDNGASWGTGAPIVTAGGDKDHVAADLNPSGEVVLFWNEGATVYTSRWNSSTWSTRTGWTRNVASVTGLSVVLNGDFQVIVAGTESGTGHPMVWAARYGDNFALAADTWGLLRTITEADAGSDVSFSQPALVLFEGLWRLFFVENFAGDAAFARLQYATKATTFDFNSNDWREAVAFDYEGNDYGVAATGMGSGRLMLASSSGVWNAELVDDIDASGDVLEVSVECGRSGARVRLELDNSAGQYASYGAGDLTALQRGARLELSPGYVTGAGAEINSSREYAYWVEAIELTGGASPRLIVTAQGGEWLLQRWRARRQYVFPDGVFAVSALVFFIASRAGIPFITTGNSSAPYDALTPAFTVHPGESGQTAIQRLIERVTDVTFFDAGVLVATDPRATDTPDYAFGPDDHLIIDGRYKDQGPMVNRARVLGDDVYGEAFDFSEIEAFGESIATVVDENLATADEAIDRADAILREATLASREDAITVFGVHCGVELYDVVDFTDPAAGLSDVPRRVLGYAWRFSTGPRARYEMTLALGEV